MARKRVLGETEKNVLTKSRRRCCLCFWLEGIDEVQKGQIAHLDQDNTNNAETNLVFLCLEHHDEYDSKTRLAKGLREDEVRHWRDMLYSEMGSRFREDVEDHRMKVVFDYLEGVMGDLLRALRNELKEQPLLRRIIGRSRSPMPRIPETIALDPDTIPGLNLKINILMNHGLVVKKDGKWQLSEELVAYLHASS